MRVTDKILQNVFLSNINKISERTYNSETRYLTGKKINKPSDDPVNALNALTLKSRISEYGQYQRNIEESQSILDNTESSIDQINDIYQELSTLAITGTTDAESEFNSTTVASDVNNLIEQIFSLANTKTPSGYLFAGTRSDTAPYQAVRDENGEIVEIKTTGSDGDVVQLIGQNLKMKVNVNGEDLFEKNGNLFELALNLRDNLRSGEIQSVKDSLSDFNSATSKIINIQSEIGSKINRVDSAATRIELDLKNFKEFLSNIEDIDSATAIVEYQQDLNSLQSALEAGSRLVQPKLIDFLS
jgi:flagellar hook-associated protein 3 FlgL